MKSAILLSTVAMASAFKPAIDLAMVHEINSINPGWTAGMNERFATKDIEHAKKLCGTYSADKLIPLPNKSEVVPHLIRDSPLPANFDSRDAFSSCKDVIGSIRDQAHCGSCWAFASTEAFNDRLCIASNGAFQTLLSPQDTVSCCGFFSCFSQGCNGGQPGMAWKWFTSKGVVTGGNYGEDDNKTCLPYDFEDCNGVPGVNPSVMPCSGSTPACVSSCSEKAYPVAYAADKHKADTSYSLSGEQQMMQDIFAHGPISAAFTVYEDFMSYKTGVYTHTTGAQLGGHAIKVIGWGTENGTNYWLVNNSWGYGWGIDGTFKIKRGTDECGIESMAVNGGTVSYKVAL